MRQGEATTLGSRIHRGSRPWRAKLARVPRQGPAGLRLSCQEHPRPPSQPGTSAPDFRQVLQRPADRSCTPKYLEGIRAIIIRNGEIIPMSREFTPETERQRLQFLGFLRPELLGNEFTHLEFPRRIQHKEVGKKMLYRDQNMNGWAYKRIEEDDLKFPLVYGEGKKARMMATIGVTRGLGDHDLKVYSSNIHIKPFLSCTPEVRVYDLTQYEHCPDDVLVLGTDGLWDVTNDREVANVVFDVLMGYEPNDPCRYTMVAQELVVRSRGVLKERGWRLANDKLGSGDDISVFVIPLGGPGNYT
ncbi:protein phosphatase 1J isoform X2 [Lacerta agilis]|uniref:protein phosphatase 1J isoform X2 n=1 Tax=Lacerta agilis TaxID=80427 RepID=UPI0014193268|nr:protein phosphatase 1J isoform X2 [Lacerta agilis]